MRGRHYRLWRSFWLALIMTSLFIAPAFSAPQAKKEHDPAVPLAWLTSDEKARFEAGRHLFEFPFTPREGLGPVFNGRNCEACHHIPMIGGSGPGYRGNIRYIVPSSGSTQGVLFHDKSITHGPAEGLPEDAIISKRRPGTLMGLGLIEAIPEEALLVNADPDDKDRDGIRGRPALKDGHVMRFGSQSHVATLFDFVADALRQEMGMTSPVPGFRIETATVEVPIFVKPHIPQPNVSVDVVNKILDFVSLLAPPERDRSEIGESQVIPRGNNFHPDCLCEVSCAFIPYQRNAHRAPCQRVHDARLTLE